MLQNQILRKDLKAINVELTNFVDYVKSTNIKKRKTLSPLNQNKKPENQSNWQQMESKNIDKQIKTLSIENERL